MLGEQLRDCQNKQFERPGEIAASFIFPGFKENLVQNKTVMQE